jgi:hypothetical protein
MSVGDVETFARAGEAAQLETGLLVGVELAAVAEIPDSYRDRVREARIPGPERLKVAVPDKYDLALSKCLRCWPLDVEGIVGIHQRRASWRRGGE